MTKTLPVTCTSSLLPWDTPWIYGLPFAAGQHWGGHLEKALIRDVKEQKRLLGSSEITTSPTLCSLMNVASSVRATDGDAVGRKESHQRTSPGMRELLWCKITSQVLQGKASSQGSHMGWHKYARKNGNLYFWRSAKINLEWIIWLHQQVLWMPLCMSAYCSKPCWHLLKRYIQIPADLCRTMIQSIPRACLVQHEITWWKTPPESPDLNPIENMN